MRNSRITKTEYIATTKQKKHRVRGGLGERDGKRIETKTTTPKIYRLLNIHKLHSFRLPSFCSVYCLLLLSLVSFTGNQVTA